MNQAHADNNALPARREQASSTVPGVPLPPVADVRRTLVPLGSVAVCIAICAWCLSMSTERFKGPPLREGSYTDRSLVGTEFVLLDEHGIAVAKLGSSAEGVGLSVIDPKTSQRRIWIGSSGTDNADSEPTLVMYGKRGEPAITLRIDQTSLGEVAQLTFGRPGAHTVSLAAGQHLAAELMLRSNVPLEVTSGDGVRSFSTVRISQLGIETGLTSREHPDSRVEQK